ncbi:MAG: hypothetical protein K2M50_03905 [Treponemataceae bacterium]|nr:hypothetical protein [Treponemataceae bacterium]
MTEFFEATMLICFGLSWPISVMKNYKSGTTKNMSLRFTFLIIAGYIFGIAAKLINGVHNFVLAVYILNLAVVMLNVFVYVRNKKLDECAQTSYTMKINMSKEMDKGIA